jgi:hypothetical protein
MGSIAHFVPFQLSASDRVVMFVEVYVSPVSDFPTAMHETEEVHATLVR